MADLSPLDEKLAEVLGLAQAAQARETKGEAGDMMQTYLAGEDEALDGFEFLTMAEAGELGHWEIVRRMGATLGDERSRRAGRLVGGGPATPLRQRAREQPEAGRGRGPRLTNACALRRGRGAAPGLGP
jgi:hypothetical protein